MAFDSAQTRRPRSAQLGAQKYLFQIKGAPEVVLALCGYFYVDSNSGVKTALDAAVRLRIRRAIAKTAGYGERVLCFAESTFEHGDAAALNGESCKLVHRRRGGAGKLTFIGFMSLIDPPRREDARSIARCHSAGIKAVMITGDMAETAMAIASKVGIFAENGDVREFGDGGDESATNANEQKTDVNVVLEVSRSDASYAVVSGSDIDRVLQRRDEEGQNKYWNVLLSRQCIVFARTTRSTTNSSLSRSFRSAARRRTLF